jgi:DHA2 family multidrug resistance protein
MNRASGLFNMLRNEGSSIGIGIATTMIARRLQLHSARLAEHLQPLSPTTAETLNELTGYFTAVTGDPVRAQAMSLNALQLLRDQQAYAQAFLDCFWIFAALAALIIPLTLRMRRSVIEEGQAIHGLE